MAENAMRAGLEGLRAVWCVTYYEEDEEGRGRKEGGRCWSTTVEAHPLSRPRFIAHQVWLYLNRERPEIPPVDILTPHVQLKGYCDPETRRQVHGARCIACGGPRGAVTDNREFFCADCGSKQPTSNALLCGAQCNECLEEAT